MAIKKKFNIDKIFEGVNLKFELIMQGFIEALEKTCLEITEIAKSQNTYKDQTNNLRSSIGYVLYDSGEKITENFEKAGLGEGNGEQGLIKGRRIANQAAALYPNDIVAVVVAGEDYALYVESKGFDVLTGPASQINSIMEKNIQIVLDSFKD